MSHRIYFMEGSSCDSVGASVSIVNEPRAETIYHFNSGNREAFGEVYRFLYPNVFYFACRFVEREEAADIAADAFLKLWRGEKNFESLQKVKTFLQVCVRNACINYLERTRMRLRNERDLAYLLDEFEVKSYESDEAKAALVKKIYLEIENLPPGARRVFKMSVIEGMGSEEIAARLGISHSTVRNQKKRAIGLIRMAIGRVEITILLLFISWALPF